MGCPILLGDIAATTPCYTDPRGKGGTRKQGRGSGGKNRKVGSASVSQLPSKT